MNELKVMGYAKINLLLDVISKLDNGYHSVEMIMHQIDLYDNIIIKKIDKNDIIISSNVSYIPTGEKNIAYKAAKLMIDKYSLNCGFEIAIEKNIPVAAGLAGGSTNAAVVIKAINKICDLKLTINEMMNLGVQIGADVPFCILGGCAVAKGIGEELVSLESVDNIWLVLTKPNLSVSTQKIYNKLDLNLIESHPNIDKMLNALSERNIYKISNSMSNVLENVTIELYPVISKIKSKMIEYGAIGSMMTGSGPTVFGIFKSKEKAEKAYTHLIRKYRQTYLTRTFSDNK
ncbi:4-(cytidine 5'-diphospho)-2-C-methyl-D-erythritol kinase [Helicovermis profundi]|uniref:4-diphosphocytidyl-2-C-methyl-D-erythritol kinase n=1 Tax=Helicovermis profundi TaxID=3065157 RepID=A0AAU9E0G4_9FIRM|nr:4-(cytidine 5'-diphospho)-2-C-methyl-D-erythritol kinase [Clostridia bacterium S502]